MLRTDTLVAFLDRRPLFAGHTLLVPTVHAQTYAELPLELAREWVDTSQRLERAPPAPARHPAHEGRRAAVLARPEAPTTSTRSTVMSVAAANHAVRVAHHSTLTGVGRASPTVSMSAPAIPSGSTCATMSAVGSDASIEGEEPDVTGLVDLPRAHGTAHEVAVRVAGRECGDVDLLDELLQTCAGLLAGDLGGGDVVLDLFGLVLGVLVLGVLVLVVRVVGALGLGVCVCLVGHVFEPPSDPLGGGSPLTLARPPPAKRSPPSGGRGASRRCLQVVEESREATRLETTAPR